MDTVNFLSPGARTLSLIASDVDAVGCVVSAMSVSSVKRLVDSRRSPDDESKRKSSYATILVYTAARSSELCKVIYRHSASESSGATREMHFMNSETVCERKDTLSSSEL